MRRERERGSEGDDGRGYIGQYDILAAAMVHVLGGRGRIGRKGVLMTGGKEKKKQTYPSLVPSASP